MCASRREHQRGVTLIELIVFIVIVSVGLAGVLAALSTTVKSSADPLQPKQALVIAEAMLEEVLLKSYCDPDTVNTATTPPTCGVHTTEATRAVWDDVDDYSGYSQSPVASINGTAISGYGVAVTVPAATVSIGGVAAKQVTVTVTQPSGQTIALSGYRMNY